jgi:FkbM family methyltransferase
MHLIERLSITLRHSPLLGNATWLWDRVRPSYNRLISRLGGGGLERNINGSDRVLLLPKFRSVTEEYEPEVWSLIMSEVRPGDVVADVGVYIGLYTVALAARVGPAGRVYAFEPNPESCQYIKAHLDLNRVAERVELVEAALGVQDANIAFDVKGGITGHVCGTQDDGAEVLPCMRLDTFLAGRGLDVLKIDVEGFEEMVLRGATELLRDPARKPRAIFIEVHPYAWPDLGVSSESLLELLANCSYRVTDVQGRSVSRIERYGEIVAYRD